MKIDGPAQNSLTDQVEPPPQVSGRSYLQPLILNDAHFIDKPPGTCKLVNDEQAISYIQ